MANGGGRVARGGGLSWSDNIGEGGRSKNGRFLRSAREARADNFSRYPFTDPVVLRPFHTVSPRRSTGVSTPFTLGKFAR